MGSTYVGQLGIGEAQVILLAKQKNEGEILIDQSKFSLLYNCILDGHSKYTRWACIFTSKVYEGVRV